MAGPSTEFLNDEVREIRAGFNRSDVALAEVRTEVRVFAGITRLFIGIFGTVIFSGLLSGIWWAATLAAHQGNLETRGDKVDARLDKIDARLGEVNSRLDKVEARLGEVNSRLDKIDGRFDKLEGRFDRLEAFIAKALAKP